MPDKFDLSQTALAFAMAAGRAENIWGDPGAITDFFAKALGSGGSCSVIYSQSKPDDCVRPTPIQVTGFLRTVGPKLTSGFWQVAWGPGVFADPLESPITTLANGIFVVFNHTNNAYIVAISPTNFASLHYVVQNEDFDNDPAHMVNTPVDLSHDEVQHAGKDTSRAQLTGGTGLGVYNLCTRIRDANGIGIAEFLTTALKTPATRLIFAGHSLGAALAPALAYQLLDGLEAAGWNRQNISVFATAGATPGNRLFVEDWAIKFPPRDVPNPDANNAFTRFNILHWNKFDFVPYGFTNLHGHDDLDWNSNTPVLNSETVVCKIGTSVDAKNKTENNLALIAQDRAQACALTKLPNTRFVGAFPVHYWEGGRQATYMAFPTASMTNDAYMFAKGMAHMGQYLIAAGIDPWEIPPPLG